MGFRKHAPTDVRVRRQLHVRASLMKPRGCAARLLITIKGGTAEALGLAQGDEARVAVLIGEGEDHGLIRLRRVEQDASIVTPCTTVKGGHFWKFFLGHVDQFVDRTERSQACQHEFVDGWLEVVLPAWADETRPKPTVRIDAVSPPIRAAAMDLVRQKAEQKEADERRRRREMGLGDAP
ncbi:MAG: hypothetical protein NXH91_11980 [Phyllobacteriaceae bacterium]|nr:hypothetical protein [Phyllobacteriaceae bacterium]